MGASPPISGCCSRLCLLCDTPPPPPPHRPCSPPPWGWRHQGQPRGLAGPFPAPSPLRAAVRPGESGGGGRGVLVGTAWAWGPLSGLLPPGWGRPAAGGWGGGVPVCGGAGASPPIYTHSAAAPLPGGVQQGLEARESEGWGEGGAPCCKGRLFFFIVWSVTQRYFCRAVCVCVCLSKTRGVGGGGCVCVCVCVRASRRLRRFVVVREPTKGWLRPKAEMRLGVGSVRGSC